LKPFISGVKLCITRSATFLPPAGPPCCLAMRREAYLAAGGLEAAGGVAGLVRRAGERGWRLAGAADVLVRP